MLIALILTDSVCSNACPQNSAYGLRLILAIICSSRVTVVQRLAKNILGRSGCIRNCARKICKILLKIEPLCCSTELLELYLDVFIRLAPLLMEF